MTKTMSSACRASTPWRTPSLTSSCWSSSRWLATMNATPTAIPAATECVAGSPPAGGSIPSPSSMSAALAAVIIPAATAFARPTHHSPTSLTKAIGSAPSPVESAVTHPYHHTWATERPPYSEPRCCACSPEATLTAAISAAYASCRPEYGAIAPASREARRSARVATALGMAAAAGAAAVGAALEAEAARAGDLDAERAPGDFEPLLCRLDGEELRRVATICLDESVRGDELEQRRRAQPSDFCELAQIAARSRRSRPRW